MYHKVASAGKFSNIYAMRNTDKGYSYNLSLSATKHFDFGLDLNASYTFTKAKAISSSISSVAQSNWRNNHSYRFSNDPEMANSCLLSSQLGTKQALYYNCWLDLSGSEWCSLLTLL